MKRFAQEKPVMLRRQRISREYELSHDDQGTRLNTRHALGRMRKKHPLDCGNPRCGICSGHKRFGHEETRQEKAAKLKMSEGDL